MRMGKAAKNQFFSGLHLPRPSLLSQAVLIPTLSFICFLIFGFSSFFVTLPILILSTIFLLTFTKKNMGLDENVGRNPPSSQEILKEEKVGLDIHQVVGTEEEERSKLQPILENVTQNEEDQHSEKGMIYDCQEEVQDIPTDNEGSDDSVPSEIFELKWTSPSNVGQNLAVSDSSVSEDDDEDNLIEISFPGSESSGLEEDPDQNLQSKLQELLPESIFMEQGFRELIEEINEMNEEENLIEIDISMGSIKYSMFEIEA